MLAFEQQYAPILLSSFNFWCENKLNSMAHYNKYDI